MTNLRGSPLTESDCRSLEACWIERALADKAGLRSVNNLEGAEIVAEKAEELVRICVSIQDVSITT
jgi:hypothetical protein